MAVARQNKEEAKFFQAEDGIRDIGVTGVQTCALPISKPEVSLNFVGWIMRSFPLL